MGKRGRYKLVRKIADGGMAEIYLGVQRGVEGFERPVVLKRILGTLMAEPQFKNLMIDEAHVAMSLLHSNIAQVFDLGQWKGRYYLVLELVDGWDLNQILNRLKETELHLPPELILFIATEVCRALAYAHGKKKNGVPMGIVHRDVSPHNVLVSAEGEVKLTDFGIAKALVRRENTVQGVIKGKLAFMSPEQASGTSIDARSDLFSVGTMMYLMLSGKRPFDAPTDLESLMRVQRCEFRALEEVAPGLPPALTRLVAKAMQREPANRFQTADEMLESIEAVQRGAFTPAGKTELKRWLAELEARDGIPSITRTAGINVDPNETQELGEEDIEFEDSGVVALGGTLAVGAASGASASSTGTAAAIPDPADGSVEHVITGRPTGPTKIEPSPGFVRPKVVAPPSSDDALFPEPGTPPVTELGTAPTKSDLRTQPGSTSLSLPAPSRLKRRTALPTIGVVVLGAGAVWALVKRQKTGAPDIGAKAHRPGREEPQQRATDSEPPLPPEPKTAPPPQVETPIAEVPALVPSNGPDSNPEHEGQEDEFDEAQLLAQVEAHVDETVIEPPAAKTAAMPEKPTSSSTRKRVSTSTKSQSSSEPPLSEVVSVRVVTTPPGAIIRMEKRVFGRAPMNLRFRSGITYELNFVKQGYETTKKLVTVKRAKQQTVKVTLKKRPQAKPKQEKSFFQRLFGG